MSIHKKNSYSSEDTYKVRMLGSVVIAEIIMLCFVHFWPIPEPSEPIYQDNSDSDQVTAVEEIQRTTQESEPPPPPPPQVPLPVPNDQVIEEEEIVFQEVDYSEFSDSMSIPMPESEGDTDEIAANPQLSPSVVYIVEPTVPRNLRGDLGEIVIIMNFLVNKDGSVDEAYLEQVRKIEKDGSYTVIRNVDEALLQEVLRVAHKWKFRPAKDQGAEVRAYATHEFALNI